MRHAQGMHGPVRREGEDNKSRDDSGRRLRENGSKNDLLDPSCSPRCSIGDKADGRAAETEDHILEALRISPRDIFANRWMLIVGLAKLQLGADAEAAGWLRRSVEANRNYPLAHFAFAAALGLVGALDEARTAAKAGLALDPGFTIRRWRASKSSDNPIYLAGRERTCVSMRLAGVPEG